MNNAVVIWPPTLEWWYYLAAGVGTLLVVGALLVWRVVLPRRRRRREEEQTNAAWSDLQSYQPYAEGPLADPDEPASVTLSRDLFTGVGRVEVAQQIDPRTAVSVRQQALFVGAVDLADRALPWARTSVLDDGDEAVLLPHPEERPTAEQALNALITRRARVRDALGAAAPQVDLHWPKEALLGYDGGIRGHLSPPLSHEFVVAGGRPRILDEVLRAHGTTQQQRVELVSLVARWLAALHAADVIHGDLDASSLAYSLDPIAVAPIMLGSARVIGHGPWHGRGRADATLNDDRYALARLILEALAPQGVTNLEEWLSSGQQVTGIEPARRRYFDHLSRRALQNRAACPTAQQWIAALTEDTSSAALAR